MWKTPNSGMTENQWCYDSCLYQQMAPELDYKYCLCITFINLSTGSCWWLVVWLPKSSWLLWNRGYVTCTVSKQISKYFKTSWHNLCSSSLFDLFPLSCILLSCVILQLDWHCGGNTRQTGWSHIHWEAQSVPSPLSRPGWVCMYNTDFNNWFTERDVIPEVTYPFACVPRVPQDGLLSAGYTDFINRIHKQIPQVTSDGKRLQVTLQMNCICDSADCSDNNLRDHFRR